MPDGNGQPHSAPPDKSLADAMFDAVELAEKRLAQEGFDVSVLVLHFVVPGEQGEGFDYVAACGKPQEAWEIQPHHRQILAHSLGMTMDEMRSAQRRGR